MGNDKQTGNTTQTTTVTPAPYEAEMNKLQFESAQQTQPYMTQAQTSGLQLINKLLTGSEEQLPPMFQQMAGVSEDQTGQMVQQSLRDLYPQFQSQGLMDSGTAMSIAGRTAGDIRNANAQFNIGAKQNLLNLALSGQAQVQQPVLAQSQMLSSRLAGLRSTTTAGNTAQYGMNPFLKSFQTSMGSVPATIMGRFGQGSGMYGGGSI